jgi:hypothetical protein
MKSINCKLLIMAVLIFEAVCNSTIATPDISIKTYQDWINEISPDGHIKAVPTWSYAGLEDIYPGESSAFFVPTLSALMDYEGKPALEMDFGSGIEDTSVIGGIEYLYDEDPDYTGKKANFSILKLRLNDKPGDYVLILRDVFNRKCVWRYPIPVQEEGDYQPWEPDVTIDLTKRPSEGNGYCDQNFDIKRVMSVLLIYKLKRILDPEHEKGKIDHFKIENIPEPATMCLLSLGMIGLFGGRKQRA